MDILNCSESPRGITFVLKVVPNAKTNQVVGVEGGILKLRVNAPPVEGKANTAVMAFLARLLGVRPSDVKIVRGERGRLKTVLVRGAGLDKIKGTIAQAKKEAE